MPSRVNQDKKYQAEMYDDFIHLMAGGKPITTIEIDEETYRLLGLIADHYKITRRQALSLSINNWEKNNEANKETI